MIFARHGAVGALLLWAGGAAAAQACALALSEHRSGRPLLQLPLDPRRPAFEIAFTHSVLGTPVLDRYEWREAPGGGRAHLVEERFEGEGYGLPTAAAGGETLQRLQTAEGPRWQLRLDRVVDPLVVRPLPAQRMRVQVDGRPPVLLGELTGQAVLLRALGCDRP